MSQHTSDTASPGWVPEAGGQRADVGAAREMVRTRCTEADESIALSWFDAIFAESADNAGDAEHLASAALGSFRLGRRRSGHDASINVYNPTRIADGWDADRTLIDVVSADQPFIIDSLLAALEAMGVRVHVVTYAVVDVPRTDGAICGPITTATGPSAESIVHIEIERIDSTVGLSELRRELVDTMADVAIAVADWLPMRSRSLELATELDALASSGRPDGAEIAEYAALLRWMEAGGFTFIGYREYDVRVTSEPSEIALVPRPGTALGVMRNNGDAPRRLPPPAAALALHPNPVILTKASSRSTVHRGVPLDYVAVKDINADGVVVGERRFIGLFTSMVYSSRVDEVPVVRAKAAAILDSAGAGPSHDRSRLLHVLQSYPRDELLYASVDELAETVAQIAAVRDRHRVKLHARQGRFGRTVSCLMYVPRDRFDTNVRLAIQRLVVDAYGATDVRFSTEISEAPLARLHLVLTIARGGEAAAVAHQPDVAELERSIESLIRTWDDRVRALIAQSHPEWSLSQLSSLVASFPASYRASVSPEGAVRDIDLLSGLGGRERDLRFDRSDGRLVHCTIAKRGDDMTLSSLLPQFHDLGAVVLDQRPYTLDAEQGASGAGSADHLHLYNLGLELPTELDTDGLSRVRDAMLATWAGMTESDTLSALLVSAGFNWWEVAVVRAYCRCLVQLDRRFALQHVMDIVVAEPALARTLVGWFEARLGPHGGGPDASDGDAENTLAAQVDAGIEALASLDADRIFSVLRDLVGATLRTTAWRVGAIGSDPDLEAAVAPMAFKFDMARVAIAPAPVPHAEIFVTSPTVEGVHLRFGPVARGGLRASDRPLDFRTEVLGLVKAQAVKNAVIVPVGAKGGFITRMMPTSADRAEVGAAIESAYRQFIGALLDITDNRVGDEVVHPHLVRCLDGDDPYLVVAADKGTATFSDIANGIAAERNFWLGDAFASGGSAGYDHKALAITARGAWVSVAHHFAQIGVDVQTDRITAVGVGDMSGDVFGNGMLSSPTIALIAAFDHRHIFIDPNPDLAASLAQRQRLFELPRSSWADYDTDTLSLGGGIYPRSAKRIELSAEACAALGVDTAQSSLTPDEVMSAILAAPVDLLWNGGIGTYVKATSQDHASAGDRANDSLRINGADLRCTVVGEGGNLGFTQLGRIEAALAGVRLNTDAIDNSGGVDCSDREVNLKILLALLESDGSLTRDERDRWLEADADAVCELVLDTNREHNELLTLAEANARGMVDVHARLLDWLGTAAGLDRHLEALPSNADLAERAHGGRGLTRPELAVVLAYVKNLLAVELSAPAPEGNPLSSDRVTLATLEAYVPPGIAAHTGTLIERHPLREPLLATMVANVVVNRGGISMVRRLVEETSASVHDVAKAHLAAWSIFDLETRRDAIDALDGIVEPEVQLRMRGEVKRLAERATRWLLRHERQPIEVGHIIERYREPIGDLYSMIADARQAARASVAFQLATVGDDGAGGLDDDIAEYDRAFGFLDLVDVAERTGASLAAVAAMSTAVEFELGLNHLRQRVVELPRGDHWETLARGALRDEFYREHAEITAAALTSAALVASGRSGSPEHSGLEPWRRDHQAAIARFTATLAEIDSAGRWDLAGASVAMRAMAVLGRSAARHITPVRPAPSTDRAAGAS